MTAQTPPQHAAQTAPEVGVRLIVAYKLGKAALQAALAVALLALMCVGVTAELHEFATRLRNQATSAWSVSLAGLLIRATTRRGVHLAIVALFADAVLSLGEGWALHRRLWWAPWLIVVATGTLLPVELVELMRAAHPGRVVIFGINLAIVVYLVRRVRKEGRANR